MDTSIVTAIIAALGPLCVAVFGWIVERNRKRDKADAEAWRAQQKLEEDARRQEFNAISQGVKGLLRGSIMRTHHECVRRGSITTVEREVLQRDYDAYQGLNGNGVATALYDEAMELPTKEKEQL